MRALEHRLSLNAQHSTATESLKRSRREIHYPKELDVENPFILLVHQGMVEDVFLEDMKTRNVEVTRGLTFEKYLSDADINSPLEIIFTENKTGRQKSFRSNYLVGCDGARSNVRESLPEARMVGESSNAKWGVLDGTFFDLIPGSQP